MVTSIYIILIFTLNNQKWLLSSLSKCKRDWKRLFCGICKKIDGELKINSIVIVVEIDEESEEDINKNVIENNAERTIF